MCVKHVTLHRKYSPPQHHPPAGSEINPTINSPTVVVCCLCLFCFCCHFFYLGLGNVSLFPWDKQTPEHEVWLNWKPRYLSKNYGQKYIIWCLLWLFKSRFFILKRKIFFLCFFLGARFLFITEALHSGSQTPDPAPPAARICLPVFLFPYHSDVWWIGLSVAW